MFGRKKKQVSLKLKDPVVGDHKLEGVRNDKKEEELHVTSQDLRASTQVC